MPALPISQQPEWNYNVYVLATTRILVMIGVAYLIKSLYTLVPLIWGSGSASIAAGGLSYPDLCVKVVVQSQQLTYRELSQMASTLRTSLQTLQSWFPKP